MQLPSALYTCDQVKALDRCAIEQFGVPGFDLMMRAGLAAFNLLCTTWPNERKLTVFCGGGNNGGDGHIIAGLAAKQGFEVRLISLCSLDSLKGNALLAYHFACDAGLTAATMKTEQLELEGLDGVVVDALLGIGLQGDVRGGYAIAIAHINGAASKVLSIDIPSGLNGDTGAVLGNAVNADVTISFIGLKRGLLTGAAKSRVGELYFDDLGVDALVYTSQRASVRRLEFEPPLLGPRSADSHKGDFGRLLVIGGGDGMGGASIMSAEAALISGAGIVNLLTDHRYIGAALTRCPELMVVDRDDKESVESLLTQSTTIVIGPGLGTVAKAKELLLTSLESRYPTVIDADALGLLAEADLRSDNWVLTPHPGGAAKLLNISTAAVQTNRFEAASELQRIYGGVVVLKGAGTLITNGDNTWLCDQGNPAMSAPGMGDVLAGVIGGLLAQGLSLIDASNVGVWAHATAGDAAARVQGRHLLATDLYPSLRELW